MKRLLLALLFAVLAVGAWLGWRHYPMWSAEALVRKQMIDPSSVMFDEVRIIDDVVCGMVNAKNQGGAYVGYRLFAVDGEDVLIAPAPTIDLSTAGQSLEEMRERLREAEARLAMHKRMDSLCPGLIDMPAKRTDYEVRSYEGEEARGAEVLARSGRQCTSLYLFRHKTDKDRVLIVCRDDDGAETEWLWKRGSKTADGPLDLPI